MPNKDLILILDTETTGNEDQDELIEFGAVMLDSPSLREIGSFTAVIRPSAMAMKRLLDKPVVKSMHEKNGLLAELDAGLGFHHEVVDAQITHWLNQYTEERTHIPYGGSGVVHFDRKYIDKFLPRVSKRITYWAYDVGSPRRMAELGGSKIYSIEGKNHRALQDARVHADELRFYVNRFKMADAAESGLFGTPEVGSGQIDSNVEITGTVYAPV